MKPNTDLSYKGVLKIHVHKPFILFYTFFDNNCAWISLDFLVQDNFVDYLGYYFGSTANTFFKSWTIDMDQK